MQPTHQLVTGTDYVFWIIFRIHLKSHIFLICRELKNKLLSLGWYPVDTVAKSPVRYQNNWSSWCSWQSCLAIFPYMWHHLDIHNALIQSECELQTNSLVQFLYRSSPDFRHNSHQIITKFSPCHFDTSLNRRSNKIRSFPVWHFYVPIGR